MQEKQWAWMPVQIRRERQNRGWLSGGAQVGVGGRARLCGGVRLEREPWILGDSMAQRQHYLSLG